MNNVKALFRSLISGRLIRQSDIPLLVYAALGLAILALGVLRHFNEDFAWDLLSELIGAIFTLFVIDTLLVRSKAKRWNIVREHIDYLIARSVHRLRDGIAIRAFQFAPDLPHTTDDAEKDRAVREQRAQLFREVLAQTDGQLSDRLASDAVFTEESYQYFNEKAEDIWAILNMKYSEYLAPELVTSLIQLHTGLKDVCAHIRQHNKPDRFAQEEDRGYYQDVGLRGLTISLRQVVETLNHLKDTGYSRAFSYQSAP